MLLMLNVAILNRSLAAAALPAAYQKDHLRSLVSAGIILTAETNANPRLSCPDHHPIRVIGVAAIEPIPASLPKAHHNWVHTGAIIDVKGQGMRASVTLDDDLLKTAHEYTGVTERAELLREALKSIIAREAGRRLLALAGTAPNIKDVRRRRVDEP
jgi:Arc/MetJ family transcription regulator